MQDIPVNQVKKFQTEMLAYFAENHKDIMSELTVTKRLSDENAKAILEAAREFKSSYSV